MSELVLGEMSRLKHKRIFVAGHKGMVGSAIVRRLEAFGCEHVIVADRLELDLCVTSDVFQFFEQKKPDVVFIAAAKVGGILANDKWKAEFLLENLKIQNNLLEASYRNKVNELCFLGSSCIYPKFASQPITENQLLTGALEPTNEAYALAKIAGVKLCSYLNTQHGTNYVSLMPTNLYGPGDNYDLNGSHFSLSSVVK